MMALCVMCAYVVLPPRFCIICVCGQPPTKSWPMTRQKQTLVKPKRTWKWYLCIYLRVEICISLKYLHKCTCFKTKNGQSDHSWLIFLCLCVCACLQGPFDVCRKVFTSGEETAHMTFIDKSDLFFHDYSLAPLFVQENYIHVRPAAAG